MAWTLEMLEVSKPKKRGDEKSRRKEEERRTSSDASSPLFFVFYKLGSALSSQIPTREPLYRS